MRVAKTMAIIGVLLLLSSCITIVGLTDGYKSLAEENRGRVYRLSELQTPARPFEGVYLVTAEALKALVEKSDKPYQIVYRYNPNCDQESCISLIAFSQICKDLDAEPFVLTSYLSDILFDHLKYGLPIYSMDHTKYRSKYVFKYAEQFDFDLTNLGEKELWQGNLYLFERGKLLGSTDASDLNKWLPGKGQSLSFPAVERGK